MADVARHDDDGVLEVHHAPLVVGKAASSPCNRTL